jgi:cytoskeleton protein RodZ
MNGVHLMSELAGADDTSGLPEVKPSAELVTAGELLRRAREAAGLHIGALAVSLKVPVKKLEALEANQFDALPDAVFARALASSVCRTLKVDPQEILDKLPQNAAKRLKVAEEGINAPFRPKGGSGVSMSAARYLSKPVMLVVGLLLLGALALVLMPVKSRDAATVVTAPVVDMLPVSPMVSEAPVMPAVVDVAPGSAPLVVPAGPSMAPVASVASGAVVPALPMTAASAVMALAPLASVKPNPAASASTGGGSASVTEGVLVLRAKAPVWVQVTDAKGLVQLSKTLTAGESAAVSGALPLAAIVGRVDATEVQVRGKAFDLLPVSKDNVARFEVK